MKVVIGGGITNSNEGVVAIGGAEEANCWPLQFLKPVPLLTHQLEGDQQGGEGVEGGGRVVEVLEREAGDVQQKLVTIGKHEDGHSQSYNIFKNC